MCGTVMWYGVSVLVLVCRTGRGLSGRHPGRVEEMRISVSSIAIDETRAARLLSSGEYNAKSIRIYMITTEPYTTIMGVAVQLGYGREAAV